MNYLKYLGHGSEGVSPTYCRSAYQPDSVKSIASTHNYAGKVTSLKNMGNNKEVVLDQAVKVSTVADKIRKNAQNAWKSLRRACMGTFTATLIGGIASAIAAVAVGALLPAFWPIAAAAGVLALGLLGFAGWNAARGAGAGNQLKQWDDPIPGYQNQRMQAGEKGFYHSYRNDYKGSIVSEQEIEQLWFSGMDKWAERFSSHLPALTQTKVGDIRTFMEECPLQNSAMQYTFVKGAEVDQKELKFLQDLSVKYASLKGQYDTVRQETEGLKKQIRQEKQKALIANDQERDCNLAPYKALLNAQKMALLSEQARYKNIVTTYEYSAGHMPARRPARSIGYPARRTPRTVTAGGRVVPGTGHQAHRIPTVHGVPARRPAAHAITVTQFQDARTHLLKLSAKLRRLESVYHAMTAPIRALHSSNKAKIERWASGELKKIQTAEDNSLLHFHKPIKAILDAYNGRHDLKDQEDSVEVDAQIDLCVDPNAPELRHTFEAPAFDPKWSEFIGEVDWEKGIVKNTVIEHGGKKATTETRY